MRCFYICDDCRRAFYGQDLERDDNGELVCPECGCNNFEICAVIGEEGPGVKTDPIDLSIFDKKEPVEIPGFESNGEVMRNARKLFNDWRTTKR